MLSFFSHTIFFYENYYKTTVIEYFDVTVQLESLDLTALLKYLIWQTQYIKSQRGGSVEPTEPLLDPPLLIMFERLKAIKNATHGHQTLPQLQIHQWHVPFQFPTSVCPLHLVTPFVFMTIVVCFIMLQSLTSLLIFQINTFCIRYHKIISEKIEIFQMKH